jgi:replication factor C subunit 2/4
MTQATTGISLRSASIPWVEKYRPRSLNDVCHQQHAILSLRKSLEMGNMPHLLLHGPSGTGKTSTILAVARELFGSDAIKSRVLELNASHERGIDTIRHKVKEFANTKISTNGASLASTSTTSTTTTIFPYKIVILDEAENMTKDAQSALRRIMEQHTNVTRFCIICNRISQIIDPIISRCAVFRYTPMDSVSTKQRLSYIAKKENICIKNDKVYDLLIQLSQGDMRKSITMLQTTSALVDSGEPISEDLVKEVSGQIDTKVFNELINSILMQQSTNIIIGFNEIERVARSIVNDGYPVDSVYMELIQRIVDDQHIDESSKCQILLKIAESEGKLIVDGADEYLQLLHVLSYLIVHV